jgi:hypothetical protein
MSISIRLIIASEFPGWAIVARNGTGMARLPPAHNEAAGCRASRCLMRR